MSIRMAESATSFVLCYCIILCLCAMETSMSQAAGPSYTSCGTLAKVDFLTACVLQSHLAS